MTNENECSTGSFDGKVGCNIAGLTLNKEEVIQRISEASKK